MIRSLEIKSTLTNRSGQVLDVVFHDIENEDGLGDKRIGGVHAYCFYQDKLVVVYAESKGYWTPPGGRVLLSVLSSRPLVYRRMYATLKK